MNRYIALFRGINVGGRNILPMKGLVSMLTLLGFENVRTYIQSGNVVFNAEKKLTGKLRVAIKDEFGFEPTVLLLTDSEFAAAVANNPYSSAEGKCCHFFFCESKPKKPDGKKLLALKAASEEFVIKNRVLYLYTPDGFGKSRLAASVERCLGVPVTARNLNTVQKLHDMMQTT